MHGSATSIAPWNVALVIVINYPLCGAFSEVVNGLDPGVSVICLV